MIMKRPAKIQIRYGAALLLSISILSACEKYLGEKPNQKLATIETLGDMQALLDDFNKMNTGDPGVANAVSDDSYVTEEVFKARSIYDQNLYLWKGDHNFEPPAAQWSAAYEKIYVANTVLDAVKAKENQIKDAVGLARVKAQALFHRARQFFNVVNIWTAACDKNTAASALGIPLRLDADFNKISTRATLGETYGQITGDLKKAIIALPVTDISTVRPTKGAAYGMLSRIYLQMREYGPARQYADSALAINSSLMDYNTLTAAANFPIARQNAEVIFDSRAVATGTGSQARALINPELYNLYQSNDLRKTVFFRLSGTAYIFKGYYAGAASLFNGIATDELLLIRAECLARADQLSLALKDLNFLLENRYKKGTYNAYQGLTKTELLNLIKQERRKELLFRMLRWGDIKRWNLEGDNIILSRTVDGKQTILSSNSLLYAISIPEDIIEKTGMPQNPR
ncbi:MAG: RagB/SusD family nutrient uptake outer membrane protein [Sphingobacteriaceae bacterium]|nr:MAG: RagB/SusD family nutrient uptake outer membrane protein [Sphingobacteriaceae bacterium]